MTLQIPELSKPSAALRRHSVRIAAETLEHRVSGLLDDTGRPVFVWSDAALGVHVYGAGVAIAVEAEERSDADELERRCLRIDSEISGEVPTGRLPLWVGSMACLPGGTVRSANSPWRGWPDARLWVPAEMMVVTDAGAWWVTTVRNGQDAAPATPARPPLKVAQSPVAQSPLAPTPPDGSEASATRYQAQVARAVQDIVNSPPAPDGLSKVVVARSSAWPSTETRPTNLVRLLAAARQQQPTATHTLVNWPGAGVCISATPERLVGLRGRTVETEALAGTAKLVGDARQDAAAKAALLGSAKDLAEHAWVARHLEAMLEPMCDEVQTSAAPGIRELASLIHLHTPVTGKLSEQRHILSLVRALHPTPAIVGSPPDKAASWLEACEGMDRGHYAGPVGWFDAAGQGEFAIALRCALLRDESVHVFAGAGVVDGSVPAKEWAETEAKLASAKRFVSVAEVAS